MGRYTVFMGSASLEPVVSSVRVNSSQEHRFAPPIPEFFRVFDLQASTARRAAFCAAVLLLGGGALLTTSGCYKPLLAPDEERSQYDRYDAIRAQRAPAFIEDEFGRRRPNLRGRLLEKQ